MREFLSSRLSIRTETVSALEAVVVGRADADQLHRLAEQVLTLGGSGDGSSAWAYSRLLEGLSWAVQWEPAVARADLNPTRFRDAARHHADLVRKAYENKQQSPRLQAAINALADLGSPDQVSECAAAISRIPLASTVTDVSIKKPQSSRGRQPVVSDRKSLPVLVLLSIDGQPLQSPMAIHAHTIYALGVASKVLDWPMQADSLVIDFVGTLSHKFIELGGVELGKDNLRGQTDLMLRGELARERLELFQTRAAFKMADGSVEAVHVVGHPRLVIATFDPATALPRNLPSAQHQLQGMIATLDAKLPKLPRQDREDLFTLLESLLRYSNRAMQDRLLASHPQVHEKDFQYDLRVHLNADPNIGARLWEAPRQGGGITDLGLGEVVLELKVEHDKAVTIDDAIGYMSQAAQYASAKDRQVSILCILDDSEKTHPPGVIGNYVDWLYPRIHGLNDPQYPSMVAAVVVPIRFPVPSYWSR